MNLLEYIKMSYLRPNKQVLKGLGASDDLIAYLMETPGNTNIVIANQLIGSNETDEDLVIFDSTATFEPYFDGIYSASINTSFTFTDSADAPPFLIVEANEETIVLPKTESVYAWYGEGESFENYPYSLYIDNDGSCVIYTTTLIGEQHIKLMFLDA